MTLGLKRWLRYIFVLVCVLILCWQNSGDSGKLTQGVCDAIRGVVGFFGGEVKINNFYLLVRKTGHAVAFLVLAFCGHLAILADAESWNAVLFSSFGLNFAIATLAEFCQSYALGRQATARDVLINLIGTLIGMLIANVYELIRRKIGTKPKRPAH